MTKKKAIIIGAGLTGLTTAFYLSKAGWQVQILERDQRAGGSIITHHENGFIFESGPNTGIISHPDVSELLQQLSNKIEIEPLGNSARRRLVWKNCRWHTLPRCLSDGLRTPLFKWNEKIRLLLGTLRNQHYLAEQFNPKNNLNPDYPVDPFIHAIYSGDFNGLLANSGKTGKYKKRADPLFRENRKKYRLRNDRRNVKVERQLFFITGGLDNLVKAMVQNIGQNQFQFGVENLNVYPKGEGFSVTYNHNKQVHKTEVPVVISTIGANEISKTFPFLTNTEKNLLSNVSHFHLIQVVVGFKKWRGIPLRAFGGLVPNNENRNILGILFPSSFLKGRAPEDGSLLSVFLGGLHHPEMINLDDETIKKMVMEEIRSMLLIPAEEPDLFHIYRHQYAFPRYNDSTQPLLSTISAIESQFPGLIMAGNIRDGIGMSHRIEQGTAIAHELVK